MWDSGLRPPPVHIITRERETLAARARRDELLPLATPAHELGVHVRTLQAAARTGRLDTHFSTRSVFGRPMRFASRAAGAEFLASCCPVIAASSHRRSTTWTTRRRSRV